MMWKNEYVPEYNAFFEWLSIIDCENMSEVTYKNCNS
jgi:hypothetical protein